MQESVIEIPQVRWKVTPSNTYFKPPSSGSTYCSSSSNLLARKKVQHCRHLQTCCFGMWVCLKIGYIPNYSHLIEIMIINHWVYGYTIFRHTHVLGIKKIARSFGSIGVNRWQWDSTGHAPCRARGQEILHSWGDGGLVRYGDAKGYTMGLAQNNDKNQRFQFMAILNEQFKVILSFQVNCKVLKPLDSGNPIPCQKHPKTKLLQVMQIHHP